MEDEETWSKGNEAFANIFYSSPDASSGNLDDEDNFDYNQDAHAGDYYHKEPLVNYEEDYVEEDNKHGGLILASQDYGGVGTSQAFQAGYASFGSAMPGMPAISMPYGYAKSPTESIHPNYGLTCKCYNLESRDLMLS